MGSVEIVGIGVGENSLCQFLMESDGKTAYPTVIISTQFHIMAAFYPQTNRFGDIEISVPSVRRCILVRYITLISFDTF